MKRVLTVVLLTGIILAQALPGFAEQKKIKMDPENIKRAAEVIKRNQALLRNKELMAKYQNLVRSLKKK